MTGTISRNFIDDLLTRVDIVQLVNSYVPLRKAGRYFTACCPFHQEKTPSFIIFPENQHYHCFGCGAHGTSITFLMEYCRLNYVEAIQELATQVGVEVVYETGHSPKYSEPSALYDILAQAATYYQQQLLNNPPILNYLRETRKLTDQILHDFNLGYAPGDRDNLLRTLGTNSEKKSWLLKAGLIKQLENTGHLQDRFCHRVVFPIHDRQGRIIGFGGRALTQQQVPKYLNSPETPLFQKGRELYGWYFARKIRQLHSVFVVEGYLDLIALVQHNIPNGVATLGTATTRDQLIRLFQEVPKLIFCFDGDAAGRQAAWRALETALPLLHSERQVYFIFLPETEDPDSFIRKHGPDPFQKLPQIPLSDLLFSTLKNQINWQTPDERNSAEQRSLLIEKAKKLLKLLPSGIYQHSLLQQLAEDSRLPVEKLSDWIFNQPSTPKSGYRPISPTPAPQLPNIKSLRDLSIAEQMIVFLLQQPNLSQHLQATDYQKLISLKQQDNVQLLLELLSLTQQNPQMTYAGIYEHWQGTVYEQRLKQLANVDIDSKLNKEQEFADAMNRLLNYMIKQRIQDLTQKNSLSVEESQELQDLFAELKKSNP